MELTTFFDNEWTMRIIKFIKSCKHVIWYSFDKDRSNKSNIYLSLLCSNIENKKPHNDEIIVSIIMTPRNKNGIWFMTVLLQTILDNLDTSCEITDIECGGWLIAKTNEIEFSTKWLLLSTIHENYNTYYDGCNSWRLLEKIIADSYLVKQLVKF